MKKFIHIIAGILLMLASGSLLAQNNSEAIKKLAKSIRNHKNMEVSFTYQTIGDTSQTEDAKDGKAYFQDEAYKFIMEDQQAISDGKTKWHYIIEDEEVMVGNATDDDNPLKILEMLEQDSEGLNPIFDEKGNLKSIEVSMDEGVKIVLNITEMKFDQDFSEGFFTFDEKAHPEVDVIDMR